MEFLDQLTAAGGRLDDVDLAEKIRSWGREVQEDNWLTFWTNEAKTNLEDVADTATKAGVRTADAVRGASGSLEDSQRFLQGTQKEWDRLGEVIERGTSVTAEGALVFTDAARAAQEKRDALSNLRGKAEENVRTTETAIEIYGIEQDAIEGTAQAYREKLDAIDRVTDATKDSIGSELDYLDAVDGLTSKLTENGATLDKNTAAGRDNQRAVLDIAQGIEEMARKQLDAGTSADEVTAKFNAQKDALVGQVAPAFGGSREAAQKYIDTILGTPPAVTTKVGLQGIPAAEDQLRSFTGKGRHLTVDVRTGDVSSIENYISGMNGRRVYVDFAPRGGIAIAP